MAPAFLEKQNARITKSFARPKEGASRHDCKPELGNLFSSAGTSLFSLPGSVSQGKEVFPLEKEVFPREETILPPEKTILPRERRFYLTEKQVLPFEGTLYLAEETFLPRENTFCLTGEKSIWPGRSLFGWEELYLAE